MLRHAAQRHAAPRRATPRHATRADAQQLANMLRALHVSAAEEPDDLRRIFLALDSRQRGAIGYDEWREWWAENAQGEPVRPSCI